MGKTKSISVVYSAVLATLFSLSLYIRGVVPYDSVFGGAFVNFGGNDPWYNMRLVESTLHNFPHRIYFDAFTYYPYGANVRFAPLFDYLLAVVIWVIGLGKPYATLGQHGIEVIGAWYPAVLGALTVIPVYFVGKELWGRNAGLLSGALIAILPGLFLARSLLGFTDHDVIGVLFSTIALLFLILAIKSAKEKEIDFRSVLRKDWGALKKPMGYSLFAGFFLGCFYLSWVGAPLFIFMLIIYAVVQDIIDHVRGENTDYLCIVTIPVFLISLAMIAPIPHLGSPGKIQALSLFLIVGVFVVLGAVSFLMREKKIERFAYPFAILALGITSFVVLRGLAPALYSILAAQLHVLSPTGAALTVGEIHPMHILSPLTGKIADAEAWRFFTTTFFIALMAFPLIAYRIARKFRPEEILIVVWSAVMLFACFGQQRFAAYYAVNVALLCGFVSWKIIEFARVGGERTKRKEVNAKKKGGAGRNREKVKNKAKNASKKAKTNIEKIKPYLHINFFLVFVAVVFVVFYPPLNMSLHSARGGGGSPEDDWHTSLLWMKENTPDPCVDYYGLYEEPKTNETTGKRANYDYPEGAYSVMSWWDYGHWITRIGHRIPFANPFQQGATKAAEYLIETDEGKANEILDELGTKYVITDFLMVDFMGASYHSKYVMPQWAGVNPNPWFTVEARLHFFDGSETPTETDSIPCLQHYRLIHESSLYLLPFMVIDSKTDRTLGWRSYYGNYPDAKSQIDTLHMGARIGGQENRIAHTPAFVKPMSLVKIFEYVEGAKIEGTAPNGSLVVLSTNITTNQGREFVYSQQVKSNGTYEFVVPYSTGKPVAGGTNFDVFGSPYKIRAEGLEKGINVSEGAVMKGETIRADLVLYGEVNG